jgi:two-component system KDP operon response regulator KdpE
MTTPAPHILVIDDEPQILRALRTILQARHFRVSTASRGEEGLALVAAQSPDVVILDLGLPDLPGTEVCARLRTWTAVPIIILSVRDSEQDKVAALDLGADDYLTKPFGVDELLARIRVALRRAARAAGSPRSVITAGPLVVDLARHVITRGGAEVRLTATEFKLLAYLAANAGRVLTHQLILSHVWGDTGDGQVEYLRVYMRQLRKKLEANPAQPEYLLTEAGVGYRFVADE